MNQALSDPLIYVDLPTYGNNDGIADENAPTVRGAHTSRWIRVPLPALKSLEKALRKSRF